MKTNKPWIYQRPQRRRVSVLKTLNKLKVFVLKRTLAKRGIISFAKALHAPHIPSSTDGITVILNSYNRPEYLLKQIESVREQSVPPKEIWIWSNQGDNHSVDWSAHCDRFVVSNYNWKFFGRFALGLLAQTKYVAFIDDDIIPASAWFENCLATIQQDAYNGILGGRGSRLSVDDSYHIVENVGWSGQLYDTPQEVDFASHTWFLERRHLSLMWSEQPFTLDNGEDMHLSYSAQKIGGLKTFVPPHPLSDKHLWCAKPLMTHAQNMDDRAHSVAHEQRHYEVRRRIVDHYRKNGWKLFLERNATET